MDGNYEEVKMETEKAIIAYMTSMPKKSVQTKETSPAVSAQPKQATKVEMSMKIGGASPTMVVSPSYSFHQQILVSSDSQPQVTIGSESMHIDSTQVIVDRIEDPFKDFGLTIVGNIVSYNSYSKE